MHPRSQNGSFQLCCLPLFLDSHWGWVLRQENDRNPSLQKSDTAPLRIWRFFLDTIYTRFFHRINRGSPWILWFFKVYHLISYHIWWIYESYMMDIWYYMMIYIYIWTKFSHIDISKFQMHHLQRPFLDTVLGRSSPRRRETGTRPTKVASSTREKWPNRNIICRHGIINYWNMLDNWINYQ